MASAVPAFASSPIDTPPVTPVAGPGSAFKRTGGNKDYYFLFDFTNPYDVPMTVTLHSMDVNGDPKTPNPTTVTIPANSRIRRYIAFSPGGNAANGYAKIEYSWVAGDERGDKLTAETAKQGLPQYNSLDPKPSAELCTDLDAGWAACDGELTALVD